MPSAKEQTLAGAGDRKKREVKKEMCPDLLSSFSDTPTSTR